MKDFGGAGAGVIVLLLAVLVFLVIYYRRRERELADRLKGMLEKAVAGTFQEGRLEDHAFSEIESDMWRFLMDCQMSSWKLTEQKEKIQALITDTSHQALTPVSNIRIYTELLKEEQELWRNQYGIPDTEEEDKIAVIQAQAEKLEFLVNSLSKLSCLEMGVIALMPEKNRISEILLGVKRQFRRKAKEKEISFSVELSEAEAVFDMKWTEEALANVVDNALKYTPAGGTVHVRAVPYQMFVGLEVSDTGIGIGEAETAKIFTRFYRSPAVKKQPGLGIGLWQAREIMAKQNGYIKVSSQPGKGSVFSLFLSMS